MIRAARVVGDQARSLNNEARVRTGAGRKFFEIFWERPTPIMGYVDRRPGLTALRGVLSE